MLTGSDMNDERFHLIVTEPGDKTRHYRGGVEAALLATLRLIPLDSRVPTEIAASVPSPSRWSAPSPSQAPPPAELLAADVVDELRLLGLELVHAGLHHIADADDPHQDAVGDHRQVPDPVL